MALEGLSTTMVAQFGNFLNVFLMGLGFVITAGFIFGTAWILKEKVFSYNIPVILKCEVGDSIIKKKDLMRILKRSDKYEVQFKKNWKIIADVPKDDYAFFSKKKKTFEAFVRDDQATWVYPKPVIGAVEEERVYVNSKGETETQRFSMPSFITMPSNLARYFMDRSRKNIELSTKVKWWQSPMILTGAIMGVFLIGCLFLFLMNKSTAEIALEAVRMGGTIMQNAAGQVLG